MKVMKMIPFYEGKEELKDAVVINFRGVRFPINRAHRELIKFASKFGDKIAVVISRNTVNQRKFFETGVRMHNLPADTSELISSIDVLMYPENKRLTVSYLLKDPDYDLDDNIRGELWELAGKTIDKFSSQVQLERIKRYSRFLLMDWLVRKYKLGEFKNGFPTLSAFRANVVEPECTSFIMKASISSLVKDEVETYKILDRLMRNPENKLRFPTVMPNLSAEQLKAFNEDVGKIVEKERWRYEKGNNRDLVEFLNKKYKDKQRGLWNFFEVFVFEDGIFENFRLEGTGLQFGNEYFEDLYVVKK